MNTRKTFLFALFFFVITGIQTIAGQKDYQPIHGLSGFDYFIKGEIVLDFVNFVNIKEASSKIESKYHLKSPVCVCFNLNDLKYFKARPAEFVGYVENQLGDGGLLNTPISPGEYLGENAMMKIEVWNKSWNYDEVTETKASGEMDPLIRIIFAIPDYAEKVKAGDANLQFRLNISANSDSYTRQKNVTGWAKAGPITLSNEDITLPVYIGCGTFYGTDLVKAQMANNLLEADKKKKNAFEQKFEQEYYKDLPRIDAMKLINFLIRPAESYEIPVSGSFGSPDGNEKVTYSGTFYLFGKEMHKME
ncbi:MAG: hypothetical protein LLG13_02135 [Bacteroidales bacterium]|nr:hypothetical protein [Bacteroidales bacterium]